MQYKISSREIQLTKKLVYELSGNRLNDNKEVMIQNRLLKLMNDLGFFEGVGELLAAVKNGHYLEQFISTFTTNKTEFFREQNHFVDLIERVFKEHFLGPNPTISIFSCASSTGEEPYSIALSFLHYKELAQTTHIAAKILATDIDQKVLEHAKEGIYRHPEDQAVFPEWLTPQLYFKRRVIPGENYFLIKAKEHLRRLIEFQQLNLFAQRYPFPLNCFDVIFCRNVLIYFQPPDQNRILRQLFSHLKLGGTLYLGHSESPLELVDYCDRAGPNIFIKVREIGT